MSESEVFIDDEPEEDRVRLDAVDQAALHANRQRRYGFIDPTKELFRTHQIPVADSGFDVGDYFPNRNAPLTVAVDVRRTAASARGIVLEMGDSTTGLAIWIPDGGTDVSACVGDSGDDGATVTAEDVLVADTQLAKVVVAVVPGSGELRIWVNGRMMDAAAAVNGALPNGWGADEAGGIGEVATTCTDRVPAGDKITLVNAAIVGAVSAFSAQRPRHFNASPYPIA